MPIFIALLALLLFEETHNYLFKKSKSKEVSWSDRPQGHQQHITVIFLRPDIQEEWFIARSWKNYYLEDLAERKKTQTREDAQKQVIFAPSLTAENMVCALTRKSLGASDVGRMSAVQRGSERSAQHGLWKQEDHFPLKCFKSYNYNGTSFYFFLYLSPPCLKCPESALVSSSQKYYILSDFAMNQRVYVKYIEN